MIQVTEHLEIPEDELTEDFIRSSGPGGQNVNKVATAVQLRFDLARNRTLPDDVKERLRRLAGRRLTGEGELIIDARRFRSQDRNRQDALERLIALIRQATEKPKPRKATRPSRGAKERRLQEKKRRKSIKSGRGPIDFQS